MLQETERRLFSALNKQTEKLQYFCSAEKISPNLAIHEIRKSFKRLRALFLFYSELPNNFSANKNQHIKELGKSVSALRESFMNLQLYEKELVGNKLVSERKIKLTIEKLQKKNKVLLNKHFEGVDFCSLVKNFAIESKQEINQIGFGVVSKKEIINQVSLSYFKSYECYKNLQFPAIADDLHRLRKKLKRVWYQLDFVKFYHPKYFKLKSNQLNKITEQLGNDHDLFVLLLELKEKHYDFDLTEIEIIENQIEHLRELNLIKLNPRLKQFFSENPEAFNEKIETYF